MATDAHQLAELIEKQHLLATLTPAQAAALPPDTQQTITAGEARVAQDFVTQWKIYGPTMDAGRETSDGNNFNQAFSQIVTASSEIARYDNENDHGDAFGIIAGDMASAVTSFDAAMNDDLAYQAAQTSSLAQDAAQASAQGVLWISIMLCIIAAGTLAVGWLIVRGIAAPIGQMTGAMRRLAQQDMNVEIPGIGRRRRTRRHGRRGPGVQGKQPGAAEAGGRGRAVSKTARPKTHKTWKPPSRPPAATRN